MSLIALVLVAVFISDALIVSFFHGACWWDRDYYPWQE